MSKIGSILEYLEINEMATVGRNYDVPFTLIVNPDRKRVGDEYFKLVNNIDWLSADKIARISFRSAIYIDHKSNKKAWTLTSKQKKALIKFFNSVSDKNDKYTNWEMAILDFNNEKGLDIPKTLDNKVNDLKYPNYLPIDLPMPDYTQL